VGGTQGCVDPDLQTTTWDREGRTQGCGSLDLQTTAWDRGDGIQQRGGTQGGGTHRYVLPNAQDSRTIANESQIEAQ
jgi:hypothetical protein